MVVGAVTLAEELAGTLIFKVAPPFILYVTVIGKD